MPIMKLLNDEEKDVITVFSYMYYPNDQTKREEFIFIFRKVCEADCQKNRMLLNNEDILKLLHTQSLDDMSNEIDSIIIRGCFQVGSMLHYLLCLDASLPQRASLNNAIGLVQNLYGDANAGHIRSKARRLTCARYWQYWEKYKSVSHLWGAWLSLNFKAKKQGANGILYRELLTESERYRVLGENHIDSKTKKPALSPGICWTPPEGYLPPLTLETVKPFRPDESMLPKILTSLASKGKLQATNH